MSDQKEIIKRGKRMFNGTNFRLEIKVVEYSDERGFPRKDAFSALMFEDVNGDTKFINAEFV